MALLVASANVTLVSAEVAFSEPVVYLASSEAAPVPVTTPVDGASAPAAQERGEHYVPFYSQFEDISDPSWRKIGCGIASLAMVIEYYEPGAITVDGLLKEGIAANAYLDDQGWIHGGLIALAESYGLEGATMSLASLTKDEAFAELREAVEAGPVMASVHYTFEPTNPIPHLVVINGIEGDTVYYNDPSEPHGGGTISAAKFKAAWKNRYIDFWPKAS